MDLRVVPDVDREMRSEVEGPDSGGMGMAEREPAQLRGQLRSARGSARGRLDDQRRLGANADEGAAPGAGMSAEHLLAGLGEHRASRGLDALRLAAEEP